MEDTNAFNKGRFVLVRVKLKGDFLRGNLPPVELLRELVAAVAANR